MDEHAEFHIDGTSPGTAATSPERRGLLTALIAGGLVAFVAPALAGRAGAATDDSMVKRSPDDDAILNALLERETRMTATYKEAVGATTDQEFQAGFLLIHDHHLAYAQAIKGYLGTTAEVPANDGPLRTITGSTASMSLALAALEDQTIAAHIDALSRIKGVDASSLIASIVTTEARHSAALALVSGRSPEAVAAQ